VRASAAATAAFVTLLAASRAPADGARTLAGSAWTASPVSADETPLDPVVREALARCGKADGGLFAAAHALVGRSLAGLPPLEPDGLELLLRAAGEPHPWPRGWVTRGRGLAAPSWAELDAWLAGGPASNFRRCGAATNVAPDGTRALAVVAVDALADLAALPIRVRPGQWLTIEARMRVPCGGGEIVVVGPSGVPRSLLTSFDGATLRARFAPEQQGEFSLQVVADVAGGPRPVLEAIVLAGLNGPGLADRGVPGERVDVGVGDDDALAALANDARTSFGFVPLARDRRLDSVAHEHAATMAHAHLLAHDAGDGDPAERLRIAGIEADACGENVAHASTIGSAHRFLWNSPSHRANLLSRAFQRIGVGVARDDRGDVWVVQEFAGR